ncbi:MAG: hypothetical protein LBS25_00870 [Candidatus Symbiothrix sp.]|jgi:hypothetical protein|nr:hypothetical protein [Candidatus Symbiothrix sp.]
MEELILKTLRKIVGKRPVYKRLPLDYTQQAAADLIFNYLSSDKPCMIARFGCVELWTVINFQTCGLSLLYLTQGLATEP